MENQVGAALTTATVAQTTGVRNTPLTTQQVAMQSQADVLAKQFVESSYRALNVGTKQAQSVPTMAMETRFLQVTENKYPQFNIVNAAAGTQKVIFGSVLALQGAYAFYGQTPSACDSALMSDDFGANIRAIQGFSNLCNHTPVSVTIIQMIATDPTQQAQPFSYGDIQYDANVNTIKLNTTNTFSRYDTDGNIVKIAGLWNLGPQCFVSVNSVNSTSMTITTTLAAAASVKLFRQIN